jgi:hypothetical protein
VDLTPHGKLGDARLTATFLTVGASGAALVALEAALSGQVAAFSAAMGAVTAISNLYVLSRIVAAVAIPYADARTNAGFVWGVIALGKIMMLFGGLWLLMTRHLVDPIPLVVGYGSLPIGIAIGAVVSDKTGPRSS